MKKNGALNAQTQLKQNINLLARPRHLLTFQGGFSRQEKEDQAPKMQLSIKT